MLGKKQRKISYNPNEQQCVCWTRIHLWFRPGSGWTLICSRAAVFSHRPDLTYTKTMKILEISDRFKTIQPNVIFNRFYFGK